DLAVEASKVVGSDVEVRSFSDAIAPQITIFFTNAGPELDAKELGVTTDLRDFVP
ncbi:hypothetical protein CRG98_048716, partial [Punica granatum]